MQEAVKDEQGNLPVDGQFVVQRVDVVKGQITVRLLTPARADLYTEDLPKSPPYRFDRAPDGRVRLPWRWFASMLERLRDEPARPATDRAWAARVLNTGAFRDVLAPSSHVIQAKVTVASTGHEVECELLVPPARFVISLQDFEDVTTRERRW